MQILEQFTEGKYGNPNLNEDTIVITPHFIGILDGSTSFTGEKIDGVPNGRFASRYVAERIAQLPPDISAHEAIHSLNADLATAIAKARGIDSITDMKAIELPATTLLLYSQNKKEIWRVADSLFRVDDGPVCDNELEQIDAWAKDRQVLLIARLARGDTVEDLLANDPYAESLKNFVAEAAVFLNRPGKFGFGIVNGTKIPEEYIEIHSVPNAKKIAFASDGYLTILDDFTETERHLHGVLESDPLMIGDFPQVKGRKPGWTSFDDRSYIAFKP